MKDEPLYSKGICPNCDGTGVVGEACPERICQKWGYGFIPSVCARQDAKGRHDQMVGRDIGDHLLLAMIGEGGFGRVYLALQKPILMKVALKITRQDRAPEQLEVLNAKFEGEARALARLNHPNIVRLIKYGLHEAQPYLVMEYVSSALTLKQVISKRASEGERFSVDELSRIFGQLLDGLEAAHAVDIIHRDIKPDNIMIQQGPGQRDFVRILDFGLAKVYSERSSTSLAIGTPVYMAPEQLVLQHLGPWTDLYALGAMLFELLTGRRPFDGQTHQEVLVKKLDEGYDPISNLDGLGITDEVLAFFTKALKRDPRQRYQDVATFRAAMEATLEGIEAGNPLWHQTTDLRGLPASYELWRALRERSGYALDIEPSLEMLRGSDPHTISESDGPIEVIGLGVQSREPTAQTVALGLKHPRAPHSPPVEHRASEPPARQSPLAIPPEFAAVLTVVMVLAIAGGISLFGDEEAPAEQIAPVSAPDAGTVLTGSKRGMVRVPSGVFRRGSHRYEDVRPVKDLFIDEFWIDVHEVSVARYQRCVDEGVCTAPDDTSDGCSGENTPYRNWGKPDRGEHPVNCVTWFQARDYCAFETKRLPTEAEWEKAARGLDARNYPWGNEEPTCKRAVMDGPEGDGCGRDSTWPVGSIPRGKSPYGLQDMAGNVSEWVADWYNGHYFSTANASNPQGPREGNRRVRRGGSWHIGFPLTLSTTTRAYDTPETATHSLGFRCAR